MFVSSIIAWISSVLFLFPQRVMIWARECLVQLITNLWHIQILHLGQSLKYFNPPPKVAANLSVGTGKNTHWCWILSSHKECPIRMVSDRSSFAIQSEVFYEDTSMKLYIVLAIIYCSIGITITFFLMNFSFKKTHSLISVFQSILYFDRYFIHKYNSLNYHGIVFCWDINDAY